MRKFKCRICGYVYYPQNGDPSQKIKPNTPFEELPLNWVCPICKADKTNFIGETI